MLRRLRPGRAALFGASLLAAALTVLTAPAAQAYIATAPDGSTGLGWSSHAPGRISWSRVDTDPTSFAVVLTRQQPPYNALIYPSVNGGSPGVPHSFYVPPPRGGFPVGEHFRVNFVDVNNHDTIYAQSNEFTIKP